MLTETTNKVARFKISDYGSYELMKGQSQNQVINIDAIQPILISSITRLSPRAPVRQPLN